jgi:S1-C subfamily serine protease
MRRTQVASEAVAKQLRVNRGAVIQAIAPDSAAARAGLLPTRRALSGIVAGDVITAIDGRHVTKPGSHQDFAGVETIGRCANMC